MPSQGDPNTSDCAQSSVKSLVRSVVGFPELEMRVAWLREQIEGRSDSNTAEQLDSLIAASRLTDPSAREAMLALAVLFARRRDSGWLWALYQRAHRSALVYLERCLRPTESDELTSGPRSEPLVPDLGLGRAVSLGERKSIARRPTRLQLDKLLRDPHPQVLDQLLRANPLREDDVVVIATRRPAHVPALGLIVNSSRWIIRRRVRLSLILNPGTPHGLALPFVLTCPSEDLRTIVETNTTSAAIRTVARELLDDQML